MRKIILLIITSLAFSSAYADGYLDAESTSAPSKEIDMQQEKPTPTEEIEDIQREEDVEIEDPSSNKEYEYDSDVHGDEETEVEE